MVDNVKYRDDVVYYLDKANGVIVQERTRLLSEVYDLASGTITSRQKWKKVERLKSMQDTIDHLIHNIIDLHTEK